MDDETLDRLVAEAKGGSSEAFGRIFDAYAGQIYRFVASRVGRPSDAEDLTQQIFVKALEALPRYEARGIPFGGWLFRLARNAVIDQVRTRRDHATLIEAATRESDEPDPELVAGRHEEIDAMARALADLTEDQREVIELRFFAGLSAREAAAVMGRQEGTIRGLQFRAIASLRRSLGLDESGRRVERPMRHGLEGGEAVLSEAGSGSAPAMGWLE
jgi:RNA polymerase sigma-70 factor, ECF subfamily